MASSSSSSSQIQQTKYDVFISFRGSDFRQGFLGHLTTALRQKHIDVYVDERLERGDEIESALVKAIEGSAISLVIFSKDYASSKWCLEELVKIIECKEVNHQIVIPVFYNVDPSDVRHQRGTFKDAFAQHEQSSRYNIGNLQGWRSALIKLINYSFGYLFPLKFEYSMEKVQSWRYALSKAANLSGYHYPSSQFENESKLINEVLKDILKKLDDIYPTIEFNDLVGFHGNLASVESLLEIESQEVRLVGLWGMGGIGKTTLARAICHKFSPNFESCCFLENVREESKKNNGLNYLLQKRFSTLLGEENVNVNDVVKMNSFKRRLCRKKILLVVDDIDTPEQLKDLAGEQPYLGAGSKVIITSRNKHALTSGGVHENAIYEIKELNFEDSLKLFSLNAFKHSLPTLGYEELSKQAVGYAKGIPLVLKVLGSHLHSRDFKTWESVFAKLKKHPNVEIRNVLKVSYAGLDYTEKHIFLDIAFFFKGEKEDDVIRFLDACGFYAKSGIATLLEKALITISYGKIQMHDLLQEMAEQIVREESIKNPGRRSRLKDIEEVLDVLKNNKGTEAIEGISLDLSQISKDIHLGDDDVFNKMSNLRILKISSSRGCKYLKLPFGFKSFPSELRYLHWDRYPLKSLPLASRAEKLVELCIINSDVQKLWDVVQDLVNLKKIDFSGSKQLTELPDFSKACNLEVVNLSECESLCSVDASILSCHTLVFLDLIGCRELKSLQSEIHFESLQYLGVDKCYNLKEFLLSSGKIEFLDLDDTKIEKLHSSFGHFKVLSILHINGSTLKCLPVKELCMLKSLSELWIRDFKQEISKIELSILFDALPNLERLNLEGCLKLFEIPDNISALSRLKSLYLNKSGVETLPTSIKLLSKLDEVHLRDGMRLRCLPELPPCIRYLYFIGCTSLETLPTNMKHLLKLKEVDLKDCRTLECLPELQLSIERLNCEGCTSLVTLPFSLKHLSYLEEVRLKDCKTLECLPELPPSIKCLNCEGCTSLLTFPSSIKHLSYLEQVRLTDCRTLECLPELPPSIKCLNCEGCTSLKTVHLPLNHQWRPEYLFFSFLGCMKMDEQSIDNVMDFSHIVMMQPLYHAYPNSALVCYPGSRVPKWLKYKEMQKANSITFELIAPSSPNPLCGFVCCCVLPPQLPFTTVEFADIRCEIWALESFLECSTLHASFNLKELNMDHVFLCYFGLSEEYEIITTSKFECRFFLGHEQNELIKACGVSPVYGTSDDDDDDDNDDDDDEQLLPPTKKLKHIV